MKIVFTTIFSFLLISGVSAQIDTAANNCIDSFSVVSLDSLLTHKPFTTPFDAQSLSELPVEDKIINLQKEDSSKQYIFLILLNLITIWVLLLNFSRNKIKKIIATIFNLNMLKQFAQVEAKRNHQYLWAYFLLLSILLTVLYSVLANKFNIEADVFKFFIIIISFLLFDIILNKFFAYLFNQNEVFSILLFNNATFLIISLPIIILSLLLLVYLPSNINIVLAYIVISTLIAINLWKELRVLFILGSNKIKIFSFYFFLYLCTFKFLPVALVLKTVWVELIK